MSIQVVSTSDSEEAVTAANGLAKESKEETKPASASSSEEVDETADDSGASEEVEEGSEDQDIKDDKEDKAKKPKSGFKKRIDRFRKQLSEKDQEIEKLRGQLSGKKPDAKAAVSESEGAKAKPKAEDFNSNEEYVEALTDWKLEQADLKKKQESKKSDVESEFKKKVDSFQEKSAEFAKTKEDFQEALEDVDDIDMAPGLQQALLSSENGPEIMYELAKNREEYERINALSPMDQFREIGKLEAKLGVKPEPKPKQTTKAPPPLTPVGSKSTGNSTKNPDDMDYDEYKKWRESKK